VNGDHPARSRRRRPAGPVLAEALSPLTCQPSPSDGGRSGESGRSSTFVGTASSE
jgi:hypothetical protein